MFDQTKLKQLENRSHVRGKLNKQFYSAEQQQLEKKRRQMKYILDQQVQQRKRQKQRQKLEQQRKIQQEQQKIKAYYAQIQDRQKKAYNGSGVDQANAQSKVYQGNKSNGSGVYQSRAVHDSNVHNNHKQNIYNQPIARSKSRSRHQYDGGDIPVMPMMQSYERQKSNEKDKYNQSLNSGSNSPVQNHLQKQHKSSHRNSAGNIPLLQLSQEEQKKQKKKSKRNPTKRDQKQFQKNEKNNQKHHRQRRPTITDQEHLNPHQFSRQQTQFRQVFGSDLNQQLQQQNKQLKKQLKKRQQAISLLMGAVRSNTKLDKFRVQAQKILHGQNSLDAKIVPITLANSRSQKYSIKQQYKQIKQKQTQSMLPRLKLHHQSIMHDYMFGSARKAAHMLKAKTFK